MIASATRSVACLRLITRRLAALAGDRAWTERLKQCDRLCHLEGRRPAADSSGQAAGRKATPFARRVVERAAETAAHVATEAAEVGERIAQLGEPVAERMATAGAGAGRLLAAVGRLRPGEGEAARARRLRRRNRKPLPNLFDVHPEVRGAPRRELGLTAIPVAEIRGTAVEGPAQRGGDFLPLRDFRTPNWRARWQRIQAAQERLAVLPPIDVFSTGDDYWVIDGHNRVAAALYGGQSDIDASVTHLHTQGGEEPSVESGSLEAVLADSAQLRAAGTGRLTPGSSIEPHLAALSSGSEATRTSEAFDQVRPSARDDAEGNDEPGAARRPHR